MIDFIMCIVLISLLTASLAIKWFFETKTYNKGICKVCNSELEFTYMDLEGNEHYECKNCGRNIYISFPFITKLFR